MTEFQNFIIPLVAGFILDLIIGDPYKLPHPIRLFGNEITYFEGFLNKGKYRKAKGIWMVIFLVAQVTVFFVALEHILTPGTWYTMVIKSILVFYGLANRSLIHEVWKVEKALQKGGVEAGRKQVQMIVGRDTSQLNVHQIRTAALETLAENLSDGVIAPLFFYVIGGLPAMFAFKMISTLDSMVGYKNERYKAFGWCGARLDDVANLIPARITALLMALVSLSIRSVKFIFKYGRKHASPNAGYPEAALAGILNVRFGGPNIYHGKLVEKPYIGKNAREITPADIRKAIAVNLGVSVMMLFAIIVLYFAFIH